MSDVIIRAWCRLVAATAREEGQAVTEYAVALVLIVAIAAAIATTGVGSSIVTKVTDQLGKI
jgi:hypothetical protein